MKPKSRVTGEAREAARAEGARAYKAGASVRDVAALWGRSYGFAHKILLEAGVGLRGRGAKVPAHRARGADGAPPVQ